MSRIAKSIGLSAVALLLTTHRLPAPISEEKPSPNPEMEKPKTGAANRKSVESSDSNSAQRFNGTWKGTFVNKTAEADYNVSYTFIIRGGKTADSAREATWVLHSPRGWSDLPDAYRHLSPVSCKTANHSDHLVADGSDLLIRFSGPPRLIDWAPKTLPLGEVQKLAGLDKPMSLTIALTLNGDELVLGNVVFHRVK
jgi:hypothetical protein